MAKNSSSELLTRAFVSEKVMVRKKDNIVGEVMVTFHDRITQPIHINSFDWVDLSSMKGVTTFLLQRSNLRRLVCESQVLEVKPV